MPSTITLDPTALALVIAVFTLLGAICAYLGGKVWDGGETGVSHQAFTAHAQPCRDAIDAHAARISDLERLATSLGVRGSKSFEMAAYDQGERIAKIEREYAVFMQGHNQLVDRVEVLEKTKAKRKR